VIHASRTAVLQGRMHFPAKCRRGDAVCRQGVASELAAKVKRPGGTAALVQAGRMLGSSSSAFFRALYEPEIAKLSRSKHAQGVQRLIELFAVCRLFEPAYNDYLRKQRNSE